MGILPVWMAVCHLCFWYLQSIEEGITSWNQSYKPLGATKWVMEEEPWSSGRVSSVLNL